MKFSHDQSSFSYQEHQLIPKYLYVIFTLLVYVVQLHIIYFWTKILCFFFNFVIKAGDNVSNSTTAQSDIAKPDKSEDTLKERPSRKSRKKEKEPVEQPSIKSRIERKLLVLPLEASVLAILLLVILGAFYVVYNFSLSPRLYDSSTRCGCDLYRFSYG